MNLLKYLTLALFITMFLGSCGGDNTNGTNTDGSDSTAINTDNTAPEPADINIHEAEVDLSKVDEASKKFCDCANEHLAEGGDRSKMSDCMGGNQEDFIKSYTEGMKLEEVEKFKVELKTKSQESCETYAIMVFGK
ncbi:MAG: hypothetical protein GY810_26950 [Aureispira sp.]|nr:hypothetical protein [Aureispira sp.]